VINVPRKARQTFLLTARIIEPNDTMSDFYTPDAQCNKTLHVYDQNLNEMDTSGWVDNLLQLPWYGNFTYHFALANFPDTVSITRRFELIEPISSITMSEASLYDSAITIDQIGENFDEIDRDSTGTLSLTELITFFNDLELENDHRTTLKLIIKIVDLNDDK
jgi:hypothetical protein